MGLAITVGIVREMIDCEEDEGVESWRKQLAELAEGLAANGVTWQEPEPSKLPANRARFMGFSYGNIHYLRRVLALVYEEDREVTPVTSAEERDKDNDLLEEMGYDFSSHLVCHSDCDGYYVPVNFEDPILIDNFVGSSQGLLEELRECAPALGINLEADESLSDAEAERIADGADDSPFRIEWETWLALHEACVQSIATGHAIVFH